MSYLTSLNGPEDQTQHMGLISVHLPRQLWDLRLPRLWRPETCAGGFMPSQWDQSLHPHFQDLTRTSKLLAVRAKISEESKNEMICNGIWLPDFLPAQKEDEEQTKNIRHVTRHAAAQEQRRLLQVFHQQRRAKRDTGQAAAVTFRERRNGRSTASSWKKYGQRKEEEH